MAIKGMDAPYPLKVVHCIGMGVICQKRKQSIGLLFVFGTMCSAGRNVMRAACVMTVSLCDVRFARMWQTKHSYNVTVFIERGSRVYE